MVNIDFKFDKNKISKALFPIIEKKLKELAKSNFSKNTKHLTSEIEKENGKITALITQNNGDYKITYDSKGFSPELESKISEALS